MAEFVYQTCCHFSHGEKSYLPLTARRSNQSILKETIPEYSLEGLILKLKLWYFGHLIRGVNSLEKTLMKGKIEGRRRRGQERMRWLDGITDSMDMNLSKLWQIVENRGAWDAIVHRVTKSQARLSDWKTIVSRGLCVLVVIRMSSRFRFPEYRSPCLLSQAST